MKLPVLRALPLLLVMAGASRAQALVINQPNAALYGATALAPPDDPGWNNVGSLNGATGVYLGNGYVLTASHVGAGTISLSGQNYNYDGLGITRLTNPGTGNSPTDLVLFHLAQMPVGIASLSIGSNGQLPDDQPVLLIGQGTDRGAAQSDGFNYANTQTKRWGTNNLSQYYDVTTAEYPFGDVHSIVTDFSENPTAAAPGNNPINEATTANGDSGGAMFYKNQDGWQLGGILFAKGRPDGSTSTSDAAFGDYGFAADLATYRSQILAVTATPEPSTYLLMGLGMLSLPVVMRRRVARSE